MLKRLISAKRSEERSGVSAERRKFNGNKECGFLPKAATPLLQRSLQPFNASTLTLSNQQRTRKINSRLLKQITTGALEELKIERAEIGIVLTSAKDMALLNDKFLEHEGPTDVITFDYSEAGGQKSEIRIHGEIFVCVEEAERQAGEFGTDWRSEIVRYIVHGILHLMGQDDLKPVARKKMKQAEGRILGRLSRRFALSKL